MHESKPNCARKIERQIEKDGVFHSAHGRECNRIFLFSSLPQLLFQQPALGMTISNNFRRQFARLSIVFGSVFKVHVSIHFSLFFFHATEFAMIQNKIREEREMVMIYSFNKMKRARATNEYVEKEGKMLNVRAKAKPIFMCYKQIIHAIGGNHKSLVTLHKPPKSKKQQQKKKTQRVANNNSRERKCCEKAIKIGAER